MTLIGHFLGTAKLDLTGPPEPKYILGYPAMGRKAGQASGPA